MPALDRLLALGVPGLFHLFLFGVALPLAAWRSRRRIVAGPLPPRKWYFASVVAQQAVGAAISLLVARWAGIDLFPSYRPTGAHALAAVGLVGLGVALGWGRWRAGIAERSAIARLVTPIDRTDHGLWAVISVSAGIGEELSYRGVFFALVARLTGDPVTAAIVASLAFGAGHLTQGWISAAAIVGVALGFHLLAAWTGALYLGMALHTAYDLIAGFGHGYLARKAGNWEEWSAIDSPARTPS